MNLIEFPQLVEWVAYASISAVFLFAAYVFYQLIWPSCCIDWIKDNYSPVRALRAYVLGMKHFRLILGPSFYDPTLMRSYEKGRELIHFLTRYKFESY